MEVTPAITIIISVAGVVVSLVGPLYYLVLDMRKNAGAASASRDHLSASQDDLAAELAAIREEVEANNDELTDEVQEMRREVRENAIRSDRNQQHLHQLLVGKQNGDDDDIGNPHYMAEYCPLPEQCTWHSPGSENSDG